jgi:hypothetical protein
VKALIAKLDALPGKEKDSAIEAFLGLHGQSSLKKLGLLLRSHIKVPSRANGK